MVKQQILINIFGGETAKPCRQICWHLSLQIADIAAATATSTDSLLNRLYMPRAIFPLQIALFTIYWGERIIYLFFFVDWKFGGETDYHDGPIYW